MGCTALALVAGSSSERQAESKWAEQWRLDPERYDPDHEVVEVASYEEWLELPAELQASARYVLLSHHEDPITKFSPALAVQSPGG